MKHFLTPLLFFIGLVGLAQPTYLDLTIQLDNYPAETSWLLTQDNDTLIYVPPSTYNTQYELIEETIPLQSGIEYKFYMFDTFGDGIYTNPNVPDGGFELSNDCQTIALFNGDNPWNSLNPGLNLSTIDFQFVLEPCVPQIPVAEVLFRVDLANAPPGIETPGVLGSWNGWQVIPMTYDENDEWFLEVEVPLGNHLWKFANFNNPDQQELPLGVGAGSCFLFDGNGYVNRTLNITSEEEITLPPYCWESCLPCGAIPGCTDFNAINWNPWANFDDNSCISQNTECGPGETTIEIIVTPDNFGGEISWKLFNDSGEVAAVNPGEYGGSPPGIPISTFLCVPTDVPYDLVTFDTYGDGLCGSCFGGTVIGNVQILDCEGIELYNLQDEWPDGNFGYDTVSEQFVPTQCGGTVAIEGCTDFNYVEFNPEATIDDGSCFTERIYGCLDETQFNYNPEANTQDIIESCVFNLTIKDGVGDGWFGSWLGIWQFGYNSPQYQMGPNDGIEESFTLTLDATQPAYIYFFVTPQSIGTTQQCGFTLTNLEGEVMIDVPFFNIIPFINESGWYAYEVDLNCGDNCVPFIEGCLDFEAFNYHPYANTEDGSCYYSPGCTSAGYVEYYTQGFEADFDNGDCQTLALFGCTDPDALNYDENANVDNETCIPKIYGCTNELAFNYDPLANTDDNSCMPIVEGCTNPNALNYNPIANTEDFSCVLPIYGCTDPEAFNFDPDANVDDQSCVAVIFGCTDETAYNFNPFANTNVGCISIVYGCTNQFAFNFNPSANIDDGSCESVIYGCTDESAFNYNPFANTNVGCESFVEGCTDVEAINYNPQANTDDGSCEPVVFGCLIPTAFNFDPEANTDNGSCIDVIFGCLDPTAFNYNELANTDNDSCEPVIEGCMDPDALNFDPLANVNDFDCIEAIYGCTDETAINYNELANVDNDTCIPRVEGCMNPEALNFNSEANVDDGSCILPIYGCTDETALNYDADANVDNDSCIEIVEGCTNPEALNYNELANVDDFSCILPIYGCTDPEAFNYNELANVDNDSCEDVVEGCTDPTAFNYNPEANTEDFSCEPFIYGCTDPEAANYDELANTDNGTCETVYAECADPVIEAYNGLDLEAGCFAWVIDVSPSCCNSGWSDGCQELYNYCEDNTVTSLEDFSETQILVFPNPTRDYINIASNLQINAVLYNYIGQPILRETNVNQLDLSRFEAGMYNLVLTYNDLQFTKKIIKQ